MARRFNYDQPDAPETVVADVVAEISNDGKPLPLTEDEILLRDFQIQMWHAERRQRDEEHRIEWVQQEAAKEEAAQREAAAIAAEQQRKARLERSEQIARETRDRELRDLRFKVSQHEWWQRSLERDAVNSARQQEIQVLLAVINPPPPPPEPQVVYVEAEPEEETFCGAVIPRLPRWR